MLSKRVNAEKNYRGRRNLQRKNLVLGIMEQRGRADYPNCDTCRLDQQTKKRKKPEAPSALRAGRERKEHY